MLCQAAGGRIGVECDHDAGDGGRCGRRFFPRSLGFNFTSADQRTRGQAERQGWRSVVEKGARRDYCPEHVPGGPASARSVRP